MKKLLKFQCVLVFALVYLQVNAQAQIQSKPADKFVDMIGVNVHSARNYNQYTNNPTFPNAEQTTINTLVDLRIRHLRDGIYGYNGGTEDFDINNRGVVTRFSAISQAGVNSGIPGGFTWIITDNTDDWQRLRDNYLVPLGNKVIVLEGANENQGTNGDPQAYRQIRNWWNNILPSLPNLKIATNTGPTAACEIATANSINAYVHYGNAHPYHFWPPFKPWGKVAHCDFNSSCAPPTISLWTAPDNNGGTIGYLEATRTKRVAANKPMIFTEWGYPTTPNDANGWGVDELTAAKYTLRGFLEHFNAGLVYSCSYELLDSEPLTPFNADPETHFGLAYINGSLKPSGTALKRMIALVEDIGNTNIPTGTLNYTLSGGGGLSFVDDKNATTNEIHQTLLQKADGKYYLILWQEATSTDSDGNSISVAPVNVTVNFGQSLSTLKAFLPTTTSNSNPIVNTTDISSYTFSVPDHPLVIEITPVTVVGSLSGSVAINTTAVDISTVGTNDWKHFSNNDHKAVGSMINSISDYATIGGTPLSYSNDLRKMSWSGGTPTATSSNNGNGRYIAGIGNGFSFTSVAGNGSNTLKVYVGGYNAGGTLTAQLSNNSAPTYVNTVASTNGQWNAVYTIVYNAAQATGGQTLNISWKQASGTGNVTIQAAALIGTAKSTRESTLLEESNREGIIIYPNPTTDELYIQLNEIDDVDLYDSMGKVVHSKHEVSGLYKISMKAFSSGMYLLKTRNTVQKVMKID